METKGWWSRLRRLVLGGSRDLSDQQLFHKVSLVALLAWVGLGADGLSSSCYGPEAAFLALGNRPYLSVFVALAAIATITVICASYSQIIALFPTGGGGYLVASKLLSPAAGLVSGCALIVDYVLTIAISVASGADAIFSMLPPHWHAAKLAVAIGGVVALTILNLRGVKESVTLLLPIFLAFLVTHLIVILYTLASHAANLGPLGLRVAAGVRASHRQLGFAGTLLLLLRAYSTGAGTYTGIEAVSNAMPILREPRVRTGKRTMTYMGASLALTVAGLLVAYLLYGVTPEPGRTLNAVLLTRLTQSWPAALGVAFVLLTLASEAALLFIAAQTGFLGGPGVLASMAMDRWFPTRFAALSDRCVAHNGILLMGGVAVVVMYLTRGAVAVLVVLYSINVFITFTLSQLGMVRHWWQRRHDVAGWRSRLAINGAGFGLTAFILVTLSSIKFREGGWVTLLVTGLLIALAARIQRHYRRAHAYLRRLDALSGAIDLALPPAAPAGAAAPPPDGDPQAKTAVILVNGFNGVGQHTVLSLLNSFPGVFRNFVFLKIGVVDAGNFKGTAEIQNLQTHIDAELDRYVQLMRKGGFGAAAISKIGTDIVAEVSLLAPEITARWPNAVFAGGQLVFPEDRWVHRLLHNYVVFALQRRLYQLGHPFLVLPIRVVTGVSTLAADIGVDLLQIDHEPVSSTYA